MAALFIEYWNIEQLNAVETDLVERYDVPPTNKVTPDDDVPLTNKVTPDVINSITNNNLSLNSLTIYH